MKSVSSYSALIFDLDGTLIDSAPVVTSILNEMRAESNLVVLPQSYFLQWISLGGLDLIANALELNHADSILALTKFRDIYFERDTPLSAFYPGAIETIKLLKSHGFMLAICSNKPRPLVNKVLTDTGMGVYFNFVLAGDDLVTKKPDPANLRACLNYLGQSADRSLFVGDSTVDQKCAKYAEVPFAFFCAGYDDGVCQNETHFVFRDYKSLFHFVTNNTNGCK